MVNIHIYYYIIVINVIGLVTNNFSHFASAIQYVPLCLSYVNNIKIGISSLIYEYMVTHTLWLVFLYK